MVNIGNSANGKSNVSFPPVKMLVLVAFFSVLVINLFEPEVEADAAITSTGLDYYVEVIGNWLNKHPDWLILYLFSFLIVPIWFLFRHAPSYPRHTLPQGFFIQVFMSVQFILLMTIIIYPLNYSCWLLEYSC